MNAKKFAKITLLLFLFLIIGVMAPKKAEANVIDDVTGSVKATVNPDGTHNVTATIGYTGNAVDSFSDLTFFVISNPGDILCQLPNTTNPLAGGGTTVDINNPNCDFRTAAPAGSQITIRILIHEENHIFLGNDGCGFLGDICRTIPGGTIIHLPIGASDNQFFVSVLPAGGKIYNVTVGGSFGSSCSTPADDCYYRLRVTTILGTLDNWPATGEYSCQKGQRIMLHNGVVGFPASPFTCDFSNPAMPNSFTLAIYKGTSTSLGSVVSSKVIDLNAGSAFINTPTFHTATSTPNDFDVPVQFLPGSVSGSFKLKLVDFVGNASGNCAAISPGVPGGTVNVYCDFSYANPAGSYWLVLLDPSNTEIDRIPLGLESTPVAGSGGSCSCNLATAPVDACRVINPTSSGCWFGYSPTVSACSPGSCTCVCTFVVPPVGPQLPGLPFTLVNFQDWTSKAQQYLIAIGVVSSIFIVPYVGVLLASGDEESIKKGAEWFKSWAFGLILLLLSGLILRIVGTDILGL